MDKESVILACDGKVGIKVLVHKSLVKIDSNNKLRMHDQLRDMGREIVRQEKPKKPGKRSRLWSHEEALDVLKKHKGTTNVEGLFLDFGDGAENHWIERIVKLPQIDPADLFTKAFEKMSDLRLLQVDYADHDGNNFGHLPREIKWLSLKGISCKCVPTISHLKKLAVLDLSGSNITDDWDGWQQIQLIKTLKVLDLSSCNLLESTPHFSCNTSLERLILDDCASLVAVHESIGHLQKLVFLSLDYCPSLTELPDGICKLSSIRSLILSDCFNLEKLPKELGNMESLTELIIDHTSVEEIPDSIGSLEKLERLSAMYCSTLKKLPNLSNLRSLQVVCLSHCWKLFEIQGISGLSLLQQLDLEYCTRLQLLPELPRVLIKLNIRGCTSMERLSYLPTLTNLKELRLDYCRELAKIEGIDSLTPLQELDLTNCINLQSLPELPSSLIKLNATVCRSIERLPNLSNLKNLQALLLVGCEKLSEIQGISGLSLLQQLDLNGCITLQSLPELPPSLIRLDISGCESLDRLPNLSMLKELKDICLRGCYQLAEIEGINCLTLLQNLDLTDCRKLQSLPELPSSLIELDARRCCSIERLPNLSNLKILRVFHLCCWNLSEFQDISDLSLLRELDLEECKMLQSLPGLPRSLIRLEIKGYASMKRSPNLSSLRSLKVLNLGNCMNLAEIYLEGCSKLQSLSELPSSLTTLKLKSCYKLQSLPKLPSNLITLELERCYNLAEIHGFESLESLIEFQVCECHTYIKTVQKSVSEGMLPTIAFNEGANCKRYPIPDDDNIKGMILYFVYPASPWLIHANDFTIEAEIQRNDGKKTIRCVHDLRIQGMNANTNKDRFYSCYFQGLTWFGFPLKKRDKIYVTNARFLSIGVRLKMLDLVMEYEAMEEDQQLEKRVVRLITSKTKERPPEYDDADYQKKEYDDADTSEWKLCIPRG